VSNPPYIGLNEKESLPPKTCRFDPAEALFAGEDGLSAYKNIFSQLQSTDQSSLPFFCEIGAGQKESVIRLAEKHGFTCKRTVKDTEGKNRVLHFEK
jgi:release factor glutamine methyltransferase